jgi:hypothetical protein
VNAEVEQRERVVGRVGVLQVQQAQVALQLRAPQGGVLVAGMVDDHVGPAHFAAVVPDGGQDLLVDAVAPADRGVLWGVLAYVAMSW